MERTSRRSIAQKADVTHEPPIATSLSKRERLERWSAVLAKNPQILLKTFEPTEYVSKAVRDGMRYEGSALSVAYNDPVLRDAGLHDDTFGTGKRFFGLSDDEMHCIVCYCHHGRAVRSGLIANVVRAFTPKPAQKSIFARACQLFGFQPRTA